MESVSSQIQRLAVMDPDIFDEYLQLIEFSRDSRVHYSDVFDNTKCPRWICGDELSNMITSIVRQLDTPSALENSGADAKHRIPSTIIPRVLQTSLLHLFICCLSPAMIHLSRPRSPRIIFCKQCKRADFRLGLFKPSLRITGM